MNYNPNGYYYQNQQFNNQPNEQSIRQLLLQNQIEIGKKQQRKEIIKAGILLGTCLILYLLIQTLMSQALVTLGFSDAYHSSKAFQYGFNVIAVHLTSMMLPFLALALILKKNFVSPFFPTQRLDKKDTFAWIGFGMSCCIAANYATSFAISFTKNVLGYELKQNGYGGPDSIISCVILVVSTVIIPAICEEIALRCCALGVLKKFGKGFAIFAVSIVFGLMHGNAVQFIFAFGVGLALAYITIKTNNIIPAMIVHGLNNGISVISEIIQYATDEKIANTVTVVIFYIWMIVGVVSIIYLGTTKKFKQEKQQRHLADNSFFVKLLCLAPGLFIPFVMLLSLTAQYITKV